MQCYLSHYALQSLCKGKCYLYFHFTNNGTEGQRGYDTRWGRKPWRHEEAERTWVGTLEVQGKIFDSKRRPVRWSKESVPEGRGGSLTGLVSRYSRRKQLLMWFQKTACSCLKTPPNIFRGQADSSASFTFHSSQGRTV